MSCCSCWFSLTWPYFLLCLMFLMSGGHGIEKNWELIGGSGWSYLSLGNNGVCFNAAQLQYDLISILNPINTWGDSSWLFVFAYGIPDQPSLHVHLVVFIKPFLTGGSKHIFFSLYSVGLWKPMVSFSVSVSASDSVETSLEEMLP